MGLSVFFMMLTKGSSLKLIGDMTFSLSFILGKNDFLSLIKDLNSFSSSYTFNFGNTGLTCPVISKIF